MKCPGCGREVRSGEPCPECSKGVSAPDGLKVEYKDFKGAEMLDIQMPVNRPPGPAEEHPGPLLNRSTTSGRAEPDTKNIPANRTVLILLAVVVAVLAGFLLIKVFLSR